MVLFGYLACGILDGLAYKCSESTGVYTVGGYVIVDQFFQNAVARFAAAPISRQLLKSKGEVMFAALLAIIAAMGLTPVLFSVPARPYADRADEEGTKEKEEEEAEDGEWEEQRRHSVAVPAG